MENLLDKIKPEINRLLSEGSPLGAVRLIREVTGLSLRDAKKWMDKYRMGLIAGTITWFDISKDLPPIGEDAFNKKNNWSDRLLVCDKERSYIGMGNYIFGSERFSHGSGNWQPTHWAFINYP